jgi:hypothetical protein
MLVNGQMIHRAVLVILDDENQTRRTPRVGVFGGEDQDAERAVRQVSCVGLHAELRVERSNVTDE